MSNIYFKCEHCQKVLAVDEAGAGRTVKCTDCGKPINIPEPEIECDCVCGKAMLAPASMAGKKVQCVECREYVEIPAIPSKKLSLKKEGPKATLQCPSCGSSIKSDYVICVNCGLNFKTGEKIKAADFEQPGSKQSRNKIIALAASVLVAFGIGIMVGIFLPHRNTKPDNIQTANASTANAISSTQDQGVITQPKTDIASNQNQSVNIPVEEDNTIIDPKSLFEQGLKYLDGDGVVKDENKAYKLIRKAAEKGHAAAQYALGLCYVDGTDVTKDLTKAAELFQKAAEQGHAHAQRNLGLCYEHGYGVTKDLTKAVAWYRKAAEQGDAGAQTNLGLCYENGTGVTKDLTQAVEWYRKAADQGHARAQNNLGACYYIGDGVTQDLTKAAELFQKAATQGEALAQHNLGNCYYNGIGITKDLTQAAEWYRKAAEQGDADAQNSLGACYANGDGVTKDLTQAAEWYKKAAENGSKEAAEAINFISSNDTVERGTTNEQFFIKPISNLFVSVPFTITNKRPPSPFSFPYIGKTSKGYLLVYKEAETNQCVVLLPFTDQIGRNTATVKDEEIIIESGMGIEFLPGFVLLKKDELYRLLYLSNSVYGVQYTFGNFSQNITVKKSQARLIKEHAAHPVSINIIKSLDGNIYYNANITRVEPDGLVIIHSSGVAKVLFTNLPEDIQQKYNYDPKKARVYEQMMANIREQRKQKQEIEDADQKYMESRNKSRGSARSYDAEAERFRQ